MTTDEVLGAYMELVIQEIEFQKEFGDHAPERMAAINEAVLTIFRIKHIV